MSGSFKEAPVRETRRCRPRGSVTRLGGTLESSGVGGSEAEVVTVKFSTEDGPAATASTDEVQGSGVPPSQLLGGWGAGGPVGEQPG